MSRNTKKVLPDPPADWHLPAPLVVSLFAAWSVIVLWCYFSAAPLRFDFLSSVLDQWFQMGFWHSYLLKGLAGFVSALWILWLCVQSGQWLLDRWGPEGSLTRLERVAFGGGLGMGIVSNAVLLLGACRLWYSTVFYTGLGMLSLLAWLRRE